MTTLDSPENRLTAIANQTTEVKWDQSMAAFDKRGVYSAR